MTQWEVAKSVEASVSMDEDKRRHQEEVLRRSAPRLEQTLRASGAQPSSRSPTEAMRKQLADALESLSESEGLSDDEYKLKVGETSICNSIYVCYILYY